MRLPTVASLRKIKPSKTWLVLGIALAIGIIAALAARAFLTAQMAAIEARDKQGMIEIVVAKSDLPKGTKLTVENLAVRPVPVTYAHSIAATPDQFERLEGQALGYPVKRGDAILWGLMETKRVPTFSARIDPGRRAITVQVDEINSISGMLEPGDFIDLLLSVDQSGRRVTLPLMQNVLVMATGQRSVDDAKSGAKSHFATVTLDTTPDQANNLVIAREAGKLTALLRNPADKVDNGADIDVASFLGDDPKQGSALRAVKFGVPVLYGGSGGKFTPEDLTLGRREPPGVPPAPEPATPQGMAANATREPATL